VAKEFPGCGVHHGIVTSFFELEEEEKVHRRLELLWTV
jgi:hypothetical protein